MVKCPQLFGLRAEQRERRLAQASTRQPLINLRYTSAEKCRGGSGVFLWCALRVYARAG